MSKTHLKTDIWKKSYLIEFLDQNDTVTDSFTFAVPPESEELTYQQRKTETKTFGGLHVEDYGMDAPKITLSGSTINNELKKIYHSERSDNWMTGEEEIYYLRDLLKKYKNEKKNIGNKILLYDLSKIKYGTSSSIKNYWRVFPGDFKIRRASDKPFTYKYTIDFTAVDMDDGLTNMSKVLAPKLDWARKAVDAVNKSIIQIKKVTAGIDKKIQEINTFLEDLDSSIRDVTSTLDTYAELLLGYAETATNMIENVNSLLNIPGDIANKALNIGLQFHNAGLKFMKAVEKVSKTIQGYGTSEYWAPQKLLDEYKMTAAEYADTWAGICTQMENNAATVVSVSKSNDLPNIIIGNPDPETGKQAVVLSYGEQEITLKDTDTFESLAADYYGSADRAIDIATYNNTASIDSLSPGQSIKVPVLSRSQTAANNLLYARKEDMDNYGRDIYLSDTGDFKASTTGDFETANGASNLAQAILLRLRESVQKRIRLNVYGIRTNISDPTAGTAYIISSIEGTVKRDPRVASVDEIRFRGTGDSLAIDLVYSDINKAQNGISGRL